MIKTKIREGIYKRDFVIQNSNHLYVKNMPHFTSKDSFELEKNMKCMFFQDPRGPSNPHKENHSPANQ